MNSSKEEIEKALMMYEYAKNPKKVINTIEEFSDCILKMANQEIINKMAIPDSLTILIAMEDFTEKIKPLIIKYGIIPNILNIKDGDG